MSNKYSGPKWVSFINQSAFQKIQMRLPPLDTRDRRWETTKLFFLVVCVFAPALGIGWFKYHGTDFSPSLFLKPIAATCAVAIGIVALLLWLMETRPKLILALEGKQYAEVLKVSFLAAIAPPICAWIWYDAVSGPISYALHQSSANRVTFVQPVQRSKHIGRYSCRYQITLDEDSFFWQRRLCGISREQHFKLELGGSIELTATISNYGMLVSHYGPVSGRADK